MLDGDEMLVVLRMTLTTAALYAQMSELLSALLLDCPCFVSARRAQTVYGTLQHVLRWQV